MIPIEDKLETIQDMLEIFNTRLKSEGHPRDIVALKYINELREEFSKNRRDFPNEKEIEKEAELRYPVKTHPTPNESPYINSQKTFIHGVIWVKNFLKKTE